MFGKLRVNGVSLGPATRGEFLTQLRLGKVVFTTSAGNERYARVERDVDEDSTLGSNLYDAIVTGEPSEFGHDEACGIYLLLLEANAVPEFLGGDPAEAIESELEEAGLIEIDDETGGISFTDEGVELRNQIVGRG